MIGYLRGALVSKDLSLIALDVSGVGYEIEVPMGTLHTASLGEEAIVYTHLSIRDDAHLLFGFHSKNERDLFRQLIKVNGVGPKLALGILSGMRPAELLAAIQTADIKALSSLSGIGKKTAERLIIELNDKLPKLPFFHELSKMAETADQPHTTAASTSSAEAIQALISLGYKEKEAQSRIDAIDQPGLSSDELIRLALQSSTR